MVALQHTATDSLAGPTVFRASTGQTPCVPRSLIALRPFRMGCSWLTVTDWLSRLCYYLMGVLVTLVGQRPDRYHIRNAIDNATSFRVRWCRGGWLSSPDG